MNLYLTHCTYKKDDTLKDKDIEVTPDKMYVGKKIQRFINKCMEVGVKWAIFSDYYGVWFSDVRHKWYEKPPSEVTPEEFIKLVNETEKTLNDFDKIFFYANYKNPRFHPLYRKLVEALQNRGISIVMLSHLSDIKKQESPH